MLHVRGPFWREGGDRGWIPCVYQFPRASARCLACARLVTVEATGGRSVCVDPSFARALLGRRLNCTARSERGRGSVCPNGEARAIEM